MESVGARARIACTHFSCAVNTAACGYDRLVLGDQLPLPDLPIAMSGPGSSAYAEAALEAADRAEARADRLQLKLDEEHALCEALRKQLRESSTSAQAVASQLRQVQGAPGAPEALGGTSLAGMQRTIATLRDKVDVEKKASNAAHAECAKLQKRLSTAARERQTLIASQHDLRAELQRRCTELDRANSVLRDSGSAHEQAVGQVSSLMLQNGRERQAYEKEIADLKQSLEIERKRSANRASRAAAAEAARRRARGDPSIASDTLSVGDSTGGGGSSIGGAAAEQLSELSEATTYEAELSASDGMCFSDDFCRGGRPMDFDVPAAPPPPSASVSAMASAAERERSRRQEVEEAAERAAAEHAVEVASLKEQLLSARNRAEELDSQLDRTQLEAQLVSGGSGARSALRTLEQQLEAERGRAAKAEEAREAAVGQLRHLITAACALADGTSRGAEARTQPQTRQQAQQQHASSARATTMRELCRGATEEGGAPSASDVEEPSSSSSSPTPSSAASSATHETATLADEAARCLQLLERQLARLQLFELSSAGLLADHKQAEKHAGDAAENQRASAAGVARRGFATGGSAPLSQMSGGAAQSPPAMRKGGGSGRQRAAESHQPQHPAPSKTCMRPQSASRPSSSRPQAAADPHAHPHNSTHKQQRYHASAAFDQRVSKAAASGHGRPSPAFEASLAALSSQRPGLLAVQRTEEDKFLDMVNSMHQQLTRTEPAFAAASRALQMAHETPVATSTTTITPIGGATGGTTCMNGERSGPPHSPSESPREMPLSREQILKMQPLQRAAVPPPSAATSIPHDRKEMSEEEAKRWLAEQEASSSDEEEAPTRGQHLLKPAAQPPPLARPSTASASSGGVGGGRGLGAQLTRPSLRGMGGHGVGASQISVIVGGGRGPSRLLR